MTQQMDLFGESKPAPTTQSVPTDPVEPVESPIPTLTASDDEPPFEPDDGRDIMAALGYARYEVPVARAAQKFAMAIKDAGFDPLILDGARHVDWRKVARIANGVLRGIESDKPQLPAERFELAMEQVGEYLEHKKRGAIWMPLMPR